MPRNGKIGSKQTIIKYDILVEIPQYPEIFMCVYKALHMQKDCCFFLKKINGSNSSCCLSVTKSNELEHCRCLMKVKNKIAEPYTLGESSCRGNYRMWITLNYSETSHASSDTHTHTPQRHIIQHDTMIGLNYKFNHINSYVNIDLFFNFINDTHKES